MTWDESRHRRDAEGQFTHTSVGSWAEKAMSSLAAKREGGDRPPGHAAAKARARQLWSIPDRQRGIERTDAEQDELDQLEQAFETYRRKLGLRRAEHHGNLAYADDLGQLYNEHGERVPGRDVRKSTAPSVASPRPPGGRSRKQKAGVRERRRGDDRVRPEGIAEYGTVQMRRGDRRVEGEFGYGARSDTHDEAGLEHAKVFIAHMKRVQPRARQEAARQPVRRTPRGTQVEGWMQQVETQIARTRGGGR